MQRRSRGNTGVLLLFYQLMSIGFEHIPPVTLGVILFCTVLYLDLAQLLTGGLFGTSAFGHAGPLAALAPWISPSLGTVCISLPAFLLSKLGKLPMYRLFTAHFFHGDDFHLYYNMMSWLWKARSIETTFGSEYVALLTFVGCLAVSVAYLGIAYAAAIGAYYGVLPTFLIYWLAPTSCAVGLSGVIFFLKTLLTRNDIGQSDIFFGMIPQSMSSGKKYAVWTELILIQLITPNVSFTAHLAGIVAGLAMTDTRAGHYVNKRVLDAAATLRRARTKLMREQGWSR